MYEFAFLHCVVNRRHIKEHLLRWRVRSVHRIHCEPF